MSDYNKGLQQPIKILATIRQGGVGGGETHLISLAENLNHKRYQLIVLSFSAGNMVDRLTELGIRCYVITTQRAFDVRIISQVRQIIKREKVDIIHAHGTRAFTNILLASTRMKIPIIYTVHGWSFHDDQFPLMKKLRIMMESFLVKRVNRTITVSESNQLTGTLSIKNFQSVVINNGINLNRFDPASTTSDIRQEHGISEDATLIGYISRVTKQKDPFTMLEAFAKVLNENTNCKLLMVGEGELKAEAIQKAYSLGINEHVIFEGFRSDVPEILKAIDIYCLPSLWEGLPIGLLEAMAMEKAIIATRVDGSKELINHEHNGLLVEPKQPEALAKAILRLHRDQQFKASLQEKTRKDIVAKYNASAMTRKIECIYQNVLSS